MPTKHSRIGLVRDSEVDAALKAAAPILGRSKADATLARELLLRGAKAVLDEDPRTELDRWLDERGGVRRATLPREEAFAIAHEIQKDIPPGRPLSEILDELREDRI